MQDLIFILAPQPGTDPDAIGFRIMTPRYGSFFCYTRDGNLVIEDRAGSTIRCRPAVGSNLKEGHAFYSIDLPRAKQGIPQHRLVSLKLADLEATSIDFMVNRHARPGGHLSYGVEVAAVVSGWMVTCGSFSLKKVHDARLGLPIVRDFVCASPFAETFQLNILSNYHGATAGEDTDSHTLGQVWSAIHAELQPAPGLAHDVRLPASPTAIQKVPASVHFLMHLNRLVEQLGYGAFGDAQVLLHMSSPHTAQLVALLRAPAVRKALGGRQSGTPPEELVTLVAWILSYWKFLDEQGRAQYTGAPLARLVALCPADSGTWVWVLEGKDLNTTWQPQWCFPDGNRLTVLPDGRQVLNSCTITWRCVGQGGSR